MTKEEAERELKELMYGKTKWLYAFAFAHGCDGARSDEVYTGIRLRDAQLRAIIKEHE